MKSVALLVLLFAACTKRNPEACCTTQEDCDAIGLPVGSDCPDDLTCLFNRCTQTSCQGDNDCPAELPHCGSDGVCFECTESSECDDVCSPAGQCVACTIDEDCGDGFCAAGHCASSIVPKFLPAVCDTSEARDLTLTEDFDTSIDLLCSEIVTQDAGPEVCVVHANTITLPLGSAVQVTGGRALALVADRGLTIDGDLFLDADGSLDGPGGGVASSGGTPSNTQGGGGAGFATGGGHGSTAAGDGAALNGGTATQDPAELGILPGGSRATGAFGGGGGGSATLISCQDLVRVTGLISLAGGGGGGATLLNPTTIERGGSGGGSGGYLALQGVAIEIPGRLFANGGGGGGTPTMQMAAGRGADGTISTSGALGGRTGGGRGGALNTPPGDAQAGVGGGGGSMGFLQTYTPVDRAPVTTDALTSPTLSPNHALESK